MFAFLKIAPRARISMGEDGDDDEAYDHSRCTSALQMLHGHHQDKGRTSPDLQTCPQQTF